MYIRQFNVQYLLLYRFSVGTKHKSLYWPKDSVITYDYENVDTHNAMNMETGTFTAPIAGVYGFTFTAHYVCGLNDQGLHLKFNEQYGGRIHFCRFHADEGSIEDSNTVHFSSSMSKGDRLQIESGSTNIWMGKISACFSGSLLKKN